MTIHNAEASNSLDVEQAESIERSTEQHRRNLRRFCWAGAGLVVLLLTLLVGRSMLMTRTLQQHGWQFSHWQSSGPWEYGNRLPHSIRSRIAPFEIASLLDRAQAEPGDLERLRYYSNLDHLGFRSTELSESSFASIGKLHSIRRFQLMSSKVDEEGFRHLNALPLLRHIEIHCMRVGDVSMKHIANCPHLESIRFWECHLDDESLVHFSKHKNLRSVNFTDTDVGNRALEHLSFCPMLNDVIIHGTRVTDAGIVYLARNPDLHYLEVAKTPIDNTAIQRFVAIRRDEVQLRFISTNVTQDCVDELQRKHPDLRMKLCW